MMVVDITTTVVFAAETRASQQVLLCDMCVHVNIFMYILWHQATGTILMQWYLCTVTSVFAPVHSTSCFDIELIVSPPNNPAFHSFNIISVFVPLEFWRICSQIQWGRKSSPPNNPAFLQNSNCLKINVFVPLKLQQSWKINPNSLEKHAPRSRQIMFYATPPLRQIENSRQNPAWHIALYRALLEVVILVQTNYTRTAVV